MALAVIIMSAVVRQRTDRGRGGGDKGRGGLAGLLFTIIMVLFREIEQRGRGGARDFVIYGEANNRGRGAEF